MSGILVVATTPRRQGCKALLDKESKELVGYLVADKSGRWILTDARIGKEVDYSELGFRHAAWMARRYFEAN